MNVKANRIFIFEWCLGAAVIALALAAWASARHPLDGSLDAYGIFPLFGIIAFSVMWTHYIMWAVRKATDVHPKKQTMYSLVSSSLVLALIIAHPLLSSIALWQDNFGLPPMSYLTVYPGKELALLAAVIALSLLLVYELHRWYGDRKWWHWILDIQVIAMIAIFYHSLSMGAAELGLEWFRVIWWRYGATFVIAVLYIYRDVIIRKKEGEYAKGK